MLPLRALHAEVDGLCLGGPELGLGLDHVGPGGHAARIPVSSQLERLREGVDRRVQQLPLGVEGLQLEVVLRQLSLEAQPDRLEVGRARLGAGLAGLDRAADPAPEVWFPRHGERKGEVRPRSRGHVPAGQQADGRRRTGARHADPHRGRGEVGGPSRAHERARLPELGLGHGEVLVRDVDLRRERAQLGIAEDFPPRAAGGGVLGAGHLPADTFLVAVGGDDRRPHVVRADHAAGHQCQHRGGEDEGGAGGPAIGPAHHGLAGRGAASAALRARPPTRSRWNQSRTPSR